MPLMSSARRTDLLPKRQRPSLVASTSTLGELFAFLNVQSRLDEHVDVDPTANSRRETVYRVGFS